MTAADYQTDFSTLPPTCSPRCNPGMHDLVDCRTSHVDPPLTRRTRVNEHPGVGILRPRSDEDGEVDGRLADWRAEQEYGGRDVD